jgi:hypothetical protein
VGRRVRIVLDMLDQVRRDYRIDPERTCLTGFSGGGRMACTIAFALPEYFGGVMPVCGTNPLPKLDYLRHRVHDRLSVALLTGEKDFNRAENEKYMFPLLRDLGVRARLWVVPGLGHGVPGPAVLAEALKWLEEDLPRRRKDVKERPALACPPDDALTAVKLAGRLLEAAESELKHADHTWRGVAMLRGVAARWGGTAPAERAGKLLSEIEKDPRRVRLIAEQGGQDERAVLQAQAKAMEGVNQAEALRAWKALAEGHPDSPEGRKAKVEARRLAADLAKRPFLGIRFAGDSLVVGQVLPRGPADLAGLQVGDRIQALGGKKVRTQAELRRALGAVKPGERLEVELERKGKALKLTVKVGSPPT